MKTRLPGVGEIERRRTIDRRRDWYKSCAMIHGPEERKKKTQGSQRVTVRRLNPSSSTNQRVLRSLFPRPDVATVSHFDVSWTWMYSCRTVRLQRAGTAKKSSHPWHFRCWSLRRNELECTDLLHWTEALHRFSSRDAIIVVGSVLEKHFDGDFTPDQEKKITFQTLSTGVPKLKTWLGTQRVNIWGIPQQGIAIGLPWSKGSPNNVDDMHEQVMPVLVNASECKEKCDVESAKGKGAWELLLKGLTPELWRDREIDS